MGTLGRPACSTKILAGGGIYLDLAHRIPIVDNGDDVDWFTIHGGELWCSGGGPGLFNVLVGQLLGLGGGDVGGVGNVSHVLIQVGDVVLGVLVTARIQTPGNRNHCKE